MRFTAVVLALLLWPMVLLAGTADVGSPNSSAAYTLSGTNTFRMFHFEDVQLYSRNNGDPEAQISDLVETAQWVCDNKESQNIKAAIFTGDLVQTSTSTAHWDNFVTVLDILDGCGMPYAPTAGNHDIDGSPGVPSSQCDPTIVDNLWPNYTSYITDRIEVKSWFREKGPDVTNNNGTHEGMAFVMDTLEPGWSVISVPWCSWLSTPATAYPGSLTVPKLDGGNVAGIMNGGWDTSPHHLQWVLDVLERYPDRKFVLVTHWHGGAWNWFPAEGDFVVKGNISFSGIPPGSVPENEALYDSLYRPLFIDGPGDRLLAVHVGHDVGVNATAFALTDVLNCAQCMISGVFNNQKSTRLATGYNWHMMYEVDKLARKICKRSIRVAHPHDPATPPEFDFDTDTEELCGYLKYLKQWKD